MVAIIRKTRFSAGHYFAIDELSDAENLARFGKASQKPGHGHNYELDVCVAGDIDPQTGMVVNLTDIKQILNEEVVEPYDFKHLNYLPEFKQKMPGLENLCHVIWSRLKPRFDTHDIALQWIRMSEMDDLYGMITTNPTDSTTPIIHFTKCAHFSASHRLYNPTFSDAQNEAVFGKCNNPNGHGHNYDVEVTVTGPQDPNTGLVIDLITLETLIETHVLTPLDHKNLNLDVPWMANVVPTAENIALKIWEQLAQHIPKPATLHRIRLIESKNNSVEYLGPHHA